MHGVFSINYCLINAHSWKVDIVVDRKRFVTKRSCQNSMGYFSFSILVLVCYTFHDLLTSEYVSFFNESLLDIHYIFFLNSMVPHDFYFVTGAFKNPLNNSVS